MTKFFEGSTPTVILLIALVVASVLVLNYALQPTMDGIEWAETTYRVQSGDSLWTISANYCPEGVDRREWVDEIRTLNGLSDSIIYPGQTLIVLAPAEEV